MPFLVTRDDHDLQDESANDPVDFAVRLRNAYQVIRESPEATGYPVDYSGRSATNALQTLVVTVRPIAGTYAAHQCHRAHGQLSFSDALWREPSWSRCTSDFRR